MTKKTFDNPLIAPEDLPAFADVRPEHVEPAITELLTKAQAALDQVVQDAFPAQWNEISKVLDVATERLSRAWSVVSHLNSVKDSPELRSAFNQALPRVTDFYTRLGADERLYAKYKAIPANTLNAEQAYAHQLAIRNFVLGGAELQGPDKQRFAQIQEASAQASQKFSENALDATDKFAFYINDTQCQGIPPDVLASARTLAEKENQSGYKLTLKAPCYLPVMQFAQDRSVREHMYRAYTTRASDSAPPDMLQYDNSALIEQLLALRLEEAKLLGYPDFASLSLVPKMAQSPGHVIDFLRDLAHKARPFAQREIEELRAFADQSLGLSDPQAWDWAFVSERLKESRYAFSEQEVKQYFPLPRVLDGLFRIVETLFEVQIRADNASVWDGSVQFYRIERQSPQGQAALLGQFYLDPSARTGKRGGAWMDDVRGRWLRPDSQRLQTPVAHLVCNFAAGVNGKPALLTHDDVITLFHEFGHGLHHLLTQVNEHDVAGISGVEWDAVELPSQMMENFCWEWTVLQGMTAHVDTQEPLPRPLFDKMIAARNFQTAMQTLRQIEFALFDMLLHTEPRPSQSVQALLGQVRQEVAVLQPPAWTRSAHTFSHIFAGGYAAGYYSYKWAEVLSADAYAAFEESMTADGLPSVETGRRYRQCILEAGGSRPAIESFKAFRGREPSLDALLRHQGMAVTA